MARRGKAPVRNALVAAATRINLRDTKMVNAQARRRSQWQPEAWAYSREVPEIKEAVRFRADALAKLRLFIATRPPGADDDSEPIPITDARASLPPEFVASCQAELNRLRTARGGIAGVVRRLSRSYDIVGECYLVGQGERVDEMPPLPERWGIKTISEISFRDGKTFLLGGRSDKVGVALDPELDSAIRLWLEDSEWAEEADSPMRGLLGECKTLQVLSQQVLAQAMRAASAGFFTLPNELSFGPPDPTAGEEGGEAVEDPFLEVMGQVLMNPIEDPSDPASVQPGLLRGPAEFLTPDYVRLIKLWDPTIDASLEERIKARIERIARGMNLPVEVIMGHMQTTFANAEQVDQDTYEDHLEPSCVLAVSGLTEAFLHPNLLDAKYAPELVQRVFVWFDPAAIIAQPDKFGGASEALDKHAISWAAYRAARGWSEDDAPEAMETLIRIGAEQRVGPQVSVALLQLLADEAGVTLPPPDEIGPGSQVPPTGTAARAEAEALLSELLASRRNGHVIDAAATIRQPSIDYGRRLMELDRELRTRLIVASNDAMTRALERAGAILASRSKGMSDVLRNVPYLLVAATLGRTIALRAATTDEALAGAWDALEAQYRSWGASAQSEALNIASRAVSGLSTSERETLQLRQAEDLDEGWTWMQQALHALASQRMFDPHPAAPALGEHDPSLRVPPGLVRQAISRAGGAAGLITNEQGGAFITLADAGTRPAGGIGTGELVTGTLREHGASTEGYVWVYGPAFRMHPFEPHADLDGVTFVNFDDDALSNTEGWPETEFYMPGDHDGCVCDVSPIILGPGESEE